MTEHFSLVLRLLCLHMQVFPQLIIPKIPLRLKPVAFHHEKNTNFRLRVDNRILFVMIIHNSIPKIF